MSRTIGPAVIPFYGEQAGVRNLRGYMRQIGGQVVDAGWSGVRSLSQILIDPAPQVAEGWDISTAVFSQSFSVAAQEGTPQGVFFKPDGTRMYLIGSVGDDINEYSLSVAWDVSTASYVQTFSVSAQETIPQGVFLKPDGLKMYICGGIGEDVKEYALGAAWDISTASYVQSFSVSAQETFPSGLFFRGDGAKLYIVGINGPVSTYDDAVNEYDLSTAWDISTASFVRAFSFSAQESAAEDIFFSPNGLRMYVLGDHGNDVNEYSLTAAWDISTASFVQSFSVGAKETAPKGLFFRPDGLKMYITGNSSDSVHEYNLTPA